MGLHQSRGHSVKGNVSDEFSCPLPAKHADSQAIVLEITKTICPALDKLHFPMKAFGPPDVELKDARRRRDDARGLLADGVDPGEQKKEAKAVVAAREQAATFEAVSREWHSRKTADLTPGHRKKILARLEKQLFPYIGNIPFSQLEPADILAAVRHAEDRGVIVTARRLAQLAGQVCRYSPKLKLVVMMSETCSYSLDMA